MAGLADAVDADFACREQVAGMFPAELQGRAYDEARNRWPDMTVLTEGLSLAEEAGEVCRAILKRHHGTRGPAEGWSAQLRQELAQVVAQCFVLAALEGFTLWKAVVQEHLAWCERDVNHDPVRDGELTRLRQFAELIANASTIEDAIPDVRTLARQALDG